MNRRALFIPGWAADAAIWQPFADGFPAGAVDRLPWEAALPGPAGSRLSARAAAAEAPVLLFGWSLGALAALETALALPDRVAALVLVSGTARLPAADGYPGADRRACRAMRARLRADARAVIRDFAAHCAQPEPESVCTGVFTAACSADLEALRAGLDYLDRTDVRAALSRLRVPALLLHGAEDQVIPVACGRFLARTLPNAQYREWAGAGHALLVTRRNELAAQIRNFLDVLDAG